MLPRPQAEGSIFKTEVTVFHYTDRPKPVNNLFIFSPLSNDFVYSRGKKTHASITVTVVRDRKIWTALRTNQIAEFVTRDRLEKNFYLFMVITYYRYLIVFCPFWVKAAHIFCMVFVASLIRLQETVI